MARAPGQLHPRPAVRRGQNNPIGSEATRRRRALDRDGARLMHHLLTNGAPPATLTRRSPWGPTPTLTVTPERSAKTPTGDRGLPQTQVSAQLQPASSNINAALWSAAEQQRRFGEVDALLRADPSGSSARSRRRNRH